MTRIVVTGASGFIGRRLLQLLKRERGIKVFAPAREEINLLDAKAVSDRFSVLAPDCVFHLAATGVAHARANENAIIAENIAMLLNIANACKAGTKIVVTGSMSEYGGSGTFSERAACNPSTAYGQAKLAMSQNVNRTCRSFGPRRRCS